MFRIVQKITTKLYEIRHIRASKWVGERNYSERVKPCDHKVTLRNPF